MQNRLKELRAKAKLSVRELADKAQCCSFTTISRIESGARKISTSQAVGLAKFFNVTIEYLLCEDITKKEK